MSWRMRWRQCRLDHHAAEVRRLMGLSPISPWKSQRAAHRDWTATDCHLYVVKSSRDGQSLKIGKRK